MYVGKLVWIIIFLLCFYVMKLFIFFIINEEDIGMLDLIIS